MFDAFSPFKDEPRKANQFTKKLADSKQNIQPLIVPEIETQKKSAFDFRQPIAEPERDDKKDILKVAEVVDPFMNQISQELTEETSFRAQPEKLDFQDIFGKATNQFSSEKQGVEEKEAFWDQNSVNGDVSVAQTESARSQQQPFGMDDFQSVVSQSRHGESFDRDEILPDPNSSRFNAHFKEDGDEEDAFFKESKKAHLTIQNHEKSFSKSIHSDANHSRTFKED